MGTEEELEEKTNPIEQRTKCKGFALAQVVRIFGKHMLSRKINFLSCFLLQMKKELQAECVSRTDVSGGSSCDGGYKLELIVMSPNFDGVPLLKRHRMVNDVMKEEMNRIHALTMKTWTPA